MTTEGGFTLAIIERAHRGALEQQYAHVLWLAHGLHRQSPMVVLLRGAAAVYALQTSQPDPLQLGERSWGTQPDYRAAISRLAADGGRVLVSANSLEALGLAGRPLLPEVAKVSAKNIAMLAGECARIWYL